MSEALHAAGISTAILHKNAMPANRWDKNLSSVMLEELQAHGVRFIGNTQAKAIEKSSGDSLKVITDAGEWQGDMVLLAVGVRPNAVLAKAAGLTIGGTGAIAVNFAQQTSVEMFMQPATAANRGIASAAAGLIFLWATLPTNKGALPVGTSVEDR